jgi:hypothetical protein
VELEMYDYTSNNWSHWKSNENLKEKCGSYNTKTFDKFTTKKQLYLEHHTQYGKYCCVMTRDINNNNNNNNVNTISVYVITQFSYLLLMCWQNRHIANYRNSTGQLQQQQQQQEA